MTLYQVIEELKAIALRQPNVRMAAEGDIYKSLNSNPSLKYGIFFLTQGSHTEDEFFDHYNFHIFYVDRLLDDLESNRIQIQSIGKDVLSNVIRTFEDNHQLETATITYNPFTQKFADECAGVYATVNFSVIKDYSCTEEYE